MTHHRGRKFSRKFRKQLEALKKSGLLRGSLTAAEQLKLISGTNNLEEACKDTVHIQECVPENPDLKKKVFASVAGFVNSEETVICSSTSCLMPSKIFSGILPLTKVIYLESTHF